MAVAAKGKQRRSEREEDADLEKNLKTPKKAVQKPVESRVRAADVRGVIEETLARVYGDLFPSLTTHDEDGNVDLEIKEEAYIITLVMYVGSDNYTPRQGVRLKEVEISDKARYCKEHAS
jgi:hypothetical protein